ncbi:alpha/beta hydrolase [Streptomyces daliensis]|uniref:Alpha/beta fold hydrolase n=1 Tax=Streptomyces daliensis TaxID=299421 RepID=A0A8T4J034_9ACTN|nr:alpha/beta fold hydrolase [Streptomyces daliensis]
MPRPATGRPNARHSITHSIALAAALLLAAGTASGCGGGDGGEGPGGSSPGRSGDQGTGSTAPSSPGEHSSGRDQDAATTASPTSSTSGLPRELTGQRLRWSPCPAPNAAQGEAGGSPSPLPDGTGWECATLKAPMNYAKPGGSTVRIEMIRAKKRDNGRERVGSLLFNFGGPGGSGVATLPSFGKDYAKLHSRYDLVSFDPRGVGRSEGVRCLSGKRLDAYFAADWTPDTHGERERLLSRQSAFADACEKRTGRLLPHLTTENTARDMDLMRHVLGDERLHYFGFSYGTELGGVYAHLYPDRVGRAAFDAVVDPTTTPEQGSLDQAKGFQLALDNYLAACARKGEECPVGQDPEEAKRRITELLAQLDARPLPTDSGRKLTESLAEGGIAQALYSRDLWQYLTEGLDEALGQGDGSTLLLLADSLNGRNQDGSYSTLQSSLTAIGCADARQRYGPHDIERKLPDFTAASPVFGPMSAWGMAQCDGWPVRGRWQTPPVDAKGSAPILLVGTTGDPATPYEGTRQMQRSLGEGVGVKLTYKGEGHGAYDSGDDCVRAKVNAYLLKGKVPADGSVCP